MFDNDALTERLALLQRGAAEGKLKPEHIAELERYRASGLVPAQTEGAHDQYASRPGRPAQAQSPIGVKQGSSAPAEAFTVRTPDGAEYEVQAPAGASEQDIMARVQAEHDATPKRMSADEEAGYIKLAKDPNATADQLVDYVASKGFSLEPSEAFGP